MEEGKTELFLGLRLDLNNNVLGDRVKLRKERTRQNKQNSKVKSNKVKQHFKLNHIDPNH